MPLKKGASKEAMEANFHELWEKWRRTKTIGGQYIRSKEKARKKITAIVLNTARRTTKSKRMKRKLAPPRRTATTKRRRQTKGG